MNNIATIILWSCVTLVVVMGVIAVILTFISARNMRKRREDMRVIHTGLGIGSRIIFAGGLYGRVVGIEEGKETVNVEIAKGTVITISRYAIQGLADKQ